MANSQHDIEKYLNGEMTPAERHALEKAALNDPFLQEALDGAEELQGHEFSNDLNVIHDLLKNRITKKDKDNVISLWGWTARIAAGLVLIAVSVALLWNVLNDQPANELAVTKTEEAPIASPPDQTSNTDSVLTTPAPAESKTSKSAIASKPIADNRLALAEQKEIEVDKEVEAIQVAPAEELKAAEQLDVVLNYSQETKDDNAPLSAPPMAGVQVEAKEKYKATTSSAEPTEGYISKKKEVATIKVATIEGKVTTEDGIALPGVNVVVKGTTTGTITDVYGNYELPILDPNQSLVFSFIGMETQELAVLDKDQVNVQLEPDVSSLSEVVVIGYGEADDENEEPKLELATPEGGRAAYKQYLEKNLRYPELALENNIEGRVTIQFTVDSFGKLSDFKVIKGLGFGCDEEVIRLVQQGPKWNPTKKDSEPVSDNVRVKMRFKSPKK